MSLCLEFRETGQIPDYLQADPEKKTRPVKVVPRYQQPGRERKSYPPARQSFAQLDKSTGRLFKRAGFRT
jgi:hypothetical protein